MHTLNLRLAPDEIGWIANDAEDRFLVVDDILLPLYEQFRAKVAAFERIIVVPFSGANGELRRSWITRRSRRAPAGFDYVPHQEDDPVSMCYTSGTTGRPKGVVYSHRSTVIHTLTANQPDHWGLSAKDSVLPVTPMFHANCPGIPYGCVMMGIKLVFPGPHLHPEDLMTPDGRRATQLRAGRASTIWLAMAQLLESDPQKYKLPKRVRALVGGAAMPESLIRTYLKHGAAVTQGWGMTEMSPVGSIAYLKPELQGASEDERIARFASAGVPAPIMDLRVVDDEGREQPWDNQAVGEIQVRPFITGSYHNVPQESGRFTGDGWLRNGDVAAIDRHGYIRIADRTKDLIKSGGEWISSWTWKTC